MIAELGANPRPPRRWELQTAGVLIAVAATALLCLLFVVGEGVLRHAVTSGTLDTMAPWEISVVRDADLYALLLIVLVLGYIAAFVFWRKRTSQVLRAVGADSAAATRHWTITAWSGCLAVAFMIRLFDDDRGAALATRLGYAIAQAGVQFAGLLLLFIGVWQIRDDVRARVAAAGVALRFEDGRLVTGPKPAPAATDSAWKEGTDLPADDAFWDAVGALAVAAGAALPLLAATGPYAHRWLLVPADGDVTAVRAQLEAGTRVTAYPTPAAGPGAAAPHGGPFHGFLDGGYRKVTAATLAHFLEQAAAAERWALYRRDDPTALRATVRPRRRGE